MLILLSPAKDISAEPAPKLKGITLPRLLDHSVPLVEKLRPMGPRKLATLMDISPKLAELNHARYQRWSTPSTAANARPAVFVFNGEAYRGLDARSLDADDLRAAQRQLRILSGLYGLLRPLDLMQDHRLEMGTKLSMGRGKQDLYAYWGDRITELLQADLDAQQSDVIINLASTEYFKAVRPAGLNARIITPVFKDRSGSGYKVVMVHAKHQRGAMARHIIQHRLTDPEALRKYDGDGYRYAASESTPDQPVFLRDRS